MQTRKASTLIELIVVLSVLIALGGVVLPLYSDTLNSATETVTQAALAEASKAMQQYWSDTKLVPLDGITTEATESQRFEIVWLFASPVTNNRTRQFDPNSRKGWNGPYFLSSTADAVEVGGPNLIDGWNRPLTVQYVNPNESLKDVRLVSAGANGVIDIPANTATSDLTSNSLGDDLYVAILLR